MSNATATNLNPVDMHVHIVGNGSGGTGCWLRVRSWHRPLAALMVRHIGLPADAMEGKLDELYVERLIQLVRGSSLGTVVILAHDDVYAEDGRKLDGVGSFYVPNDYILSLARKYRAFLPAVSIHPARPDALKELERCLANGAVMMKSLPNCHNINCNDRRFTRFWERMAEAGLPLLAHTGDEHTLPVVRKEFADPRILTLPLECGVKVIAAHCGTKSGLLAREYFHVFAEMIQRFPNLYGDTSAFNVPIRGRHIPKCLREPLVSRMVHGSDFPVPVHGHFAWLRGLLSWNDFRRCEGRPLAACYASRQSRPIATVWRMWNYVADINAGEGDEERYRQFCLGRARAFAAEMADARAIGYPAASAVGKRGSARTLEVCWIASRLPGITVENPRQVSAFEYPREYGPASPTFSRATVTSDRLLLVSGTASIVGHISMHAGNLAAQIEETFRNIDALVERSTAERLIKPTPLDQHSTVKAYLRDASTLPA